MSELQHDQPAGGSALCYPWCKACVAELNCNHTKPVYGCKGCIKQRDLGFPPVTVTWFKPNRHAKNQALNVNRGLHPMGLRLHPDETKTCGSCSHLIRHKFSKTYQKCDLVNNTHGHATDIRLKWRACERWEEIDGQVPA